MPRQCAVWECNNHSSPTVQLLKFPLFDENRTQQWIKVANRGPNWKPTTSSKICSQHFTRLKFDSRKRVLTDPYSDKTIVPSPKIAKSTVNLTFARVTLSLSAAANQLPGGGVHVGLVKPKAMQTSEIQVNKCKSVSTQTMPTRLKIKYAKLHKDLRLERLKNKALAKRLLHRKKQCKVQRAFKKNMWMKLDQCLLLKTLVLRLLTPTKKIDSTLRSFAQTVHYYSAKAHGFVRNSLNMLIPNDRSIRHWNQYIQLHPGFIEASLSHIQKLSMSSKSTTLCSLQFDEMHIREQVFSNGESFEGYTDYGGYFVPKNRKIANSVLVLMAVGINGNWKIPIAFFYTRGLPVKFLQNIIPECLSRLDSSGAVCKAVICDGLASNLSCFEKLGAKLDAEDPRPWFLHPNGDQRVFIILDACHMLKLLRNLWKHFKNIMHHDKTLSWYFIDSLVRHQETEGLRAGNRLTSRHSHIELQKMKVNLATQVFSESVSNALLLCEELRLPAFQDCRPTAEFISTINCLFDILNSSHPNAKGFKAPLSNENKAFWEATFRKAERLLLNLRVRTKDGVVPVYKSKRRTAILGLIGAMKTLKELSSELLSGPNPQLKYLLTYKLSQDHIETFISTIRNVLGRNSNPNVVQFKSALKKVLTSKILPNTNGNCTPQDTTEAEILRTSSKPSIKKTSPEVVQDEDDEIALDINILSQFSQCVVSYIAGWVIRKLKLKVKCNVCLSALETFKTDSMDYALILRKQRGGLLVPSEDMIKVCKSAEAAYQEANVSLFRRVKVQNAVLSAVIQNKLFQNLVDHLYDSEPHQNHIIQLTKLITHEYLNLRMHHTAKCRTLENKPVTFRNRNTTFTHFAGL